MNWSDKCGVLVTLTGKVVPIDTPGASNTVVLW